LVSQGFVVSKEHHKQQQKKVKSCAYENQILSHFPSGGGNEFAKDDVI